MTCTTKALRSFILRQRVLGMQKRKGGFSPRVSRLPSKRAILQYHIIECASPGACGAPTTICKVACMLVYRPTRRQTPRARARAPQMCRGLPYATAPHTPRCSRQRHRTRRRRAPRGGEGGTARDSRPRARHCDVPAAGNQISNAELADTSPHWGRADELPNHRIQHFGRARAIRAIKEVTEVQHKLATGGGERRDSVTQLLKLRQARPAATELLSPNEENAANTRTDRMAVVALAAKERGAIGAVTVLHVRDNSKHEGARSGGSCCTGHRGRWKRRCKREHGRSDTPASRRTL